MIMVLALALTVLVVVVGCNDEQAVMTEDSSLEGTYVGYSWRNEADGVEFEDADRYVETILHLNEDGIIEDAKMLYFQQADGYLTARQDGSADVWVDFSVDPTKAEALEGSDYQAGESMFKISTSNLMSFYAAAVAEDGTTAATIVDPWTRFQFEMKFPANFDFDDTTVGEMTIGSDLIVPTGRTGGSHPAEWEDLADKNILNIHPTWSHVVNDEGVLEDIDQDSSTRELLEAMGVEFASGQPQAMAVEYGYFGLGGWSGNYEAIEEYLIGQDATEVTSLIDWEDNPRWSDAVNEDNVFGVDVPSGATRTVQNSFDTIAGATVRMSRESTSYQRALLDAGILDEDEVISTGRF
ncbi:hypothetical protein [Natroniella sp. ANB-PHB2]|uniref:hypothetical protein n=1 Tax=Natroniella sp. ANB-PHB2 TaxID=3384444 RepID=UPI0038D484AF